MENHDNSILQSRYQFLQCQLSELGYEYKFPFEVIPLLEHLVADLLQTTDTLKHYKDLSQNCLQTCHDLEMFIGAIKKDDTEHLLHSVYERYKKDDSEHLLHKFYENSNKTDDKEHLLKKIQDLSIIERDLTSEMTKLSNLNATHKKQNLELETKLHDRENEHKDLTSEMTRLRNTNTSNKKQIEELENKLRGRQTEDADLKSEIARLGNINIIYKKHILELENRPADTKQNKYKSNLASKLDLQVSKKVLHPRNATKPKAQPSAHQCEYCKLSEKMIVEYKDKLEALQVEKSELINSEAELKNSTECYKQHMAHLRNELQAAQAELQQQKSETSRLIKLQDETQDLKNQIREYIAKMRATEEILLQKNHTHNCEHCIMIERKNVEYKDKLHALQVEKNEFHKKEFELQKTIECNKQHILQLRTELQAAQMEHQRQKSETNKLIQLQDETRDLRDQIHDYIAKVRATEEMLQEKDRERCEMLDHFRMLTIETTQLENNKQSLESEAHSVRTRLRDSETKVADLEQMMRSKDDLIAGYEEQLNELTKQIAALEMQVSNLTLQRDQLKSDLEIKYLQQSLYHQL